MRRARVCFWTLLGVVTAAGAVGAQEPANRTAPQAPRRSAPNARPPSFVSPEVHADRRVTFRVWAPRAEQVSVWGEWGGEAAFTRGEDGLWSATVGPLEPGLYGYTLNVDGFQTLDPSNPRVKPMGVSQTSILEVTGDTPRLDEVQDVPHGSVHTHLYHSRSLGVPRSFTVYTPPGYEKSGRTRYPVVYLFHGAGDNEATWTALGRAHIVLDNLIAQGRIRPMVLVMSYGHVPEAPRGGGTERMDPLRSFEADLLKDVMPLAESLYRLRREPAGRAIVGLSMGGRQSLTLGVEHPELFGWVGGFSSAVMFPEGSPGPDLSRVEGSKSKLKLLWFACGKEDFLFRQNQSFDALLKAKGIPHEFVVTDGGHAWPVWRRYLPVFLGKVFR